MPLKPPDISRWAAGNTGVPYAWHFDTGVAGPKLGITALVHGNEICGAVVLNALLDQLVTHECQLLCGQLTLIFANVTAFETFREETPFASRCIDQDMNRVWDSAHLDSDETDAELARARALRPLIDRIDYLLDLHSMSEGEIPLMLAGQTEKSLSLAKALAYPQDIMRDSGHTAGKRLFNYGEFDNPASPKTALLIECGQHWQISSAKVAGEITRRFLAHFGFIDYTAAPAPKQQVIQITHTHTIKSASFQWLDKWPNLYIVPLADTLLATDGLDDLRTPYPDCVMVMPALVPKVGVTAVRLGKFL
jgi:predicted deacylase